MHPVLFYIGDFAVPTYGAILVFAFLISVYLLRGEAQRMGLDGKKTADAAIMALLFGLIGAKLLLILVDLPEYIREPRLFWVNIRSAGVIYGGLISGSIGTIWYVRRHNLPLWPSLDVLSPFAALGMGLGRLSCLMAGCCHGIRYDGPFALHFPDHPYCQAPPDVGLFPVQALGLINGLLVFAILLFLLRRRRFDGQIFAALMVLYGLTRGAIEFLRGDSGRGLWLDQTLSTSQLIAIAAVLFGVWLYWRQSKQANRQKDEQGAMS